MSLPTAITQSYHQGRLLVLWGVVPLPLTERPLANPTLMLNQWTARTNNLPVVALSLPHLPPLPFLSLDPTNRLTQAFQTAGVPLHVVTTRRNVPAAGQHNLLPLAGNLSTRSGVVLSRGELPDLHNDPDKNHLLTEARRIIENGALLLLGSDPTNEDFSAWWAVLAPALGHPPAFAVGELSLPWPPGITCLDLDFNTVNIALWVDVPGLQMPSLKGDITMPNQDDLQNLLNINERRLQILKEQKAGFGSLHCPPHITMGIEKATAEVNKLRSQLGLPPLEPEMESEATSQSPPQVGDTTYNINIQNATGLAIGDQAQVTQQGSGEVGTPPGGQPGSTATQHPTQRCEDLAENIGETQALIKDYEDQRRLANDPKAKRRAEKEIEDLRQQLSEYEAEARRLGCE